jgi:hypothetical protein
MNRTFGVFSLAVALLAGGCAYYKIQPVLLASLKDWGKTNGLSGECIFYQPELDFSAMILTDATKAGGGVPAKQVIVTPLYLPNYQKAVPDDDPEFSG